MGTSLHSQGVLPILSYSETIIKALASTKSHVTCPELNGLNVLQERNCMMDL